MFTDLAPMITRKRIIMEATLSELPTQIHLNDYMVELSKVMDMTIVSNPVFQSDPDYGLSAYMCWKESGMHIYTWKETYTRPNFISIDIYTCKEFDRQKVIDFTKNTFHKYVQFTWKE